MSVCLSHWCDGYREQHHRRGQEHRLWHLCRRLPLFRHLHGAEGPLQHPKEDAVADAIQSNVQAEQMACTLPDALRVADEKASRLMTEYLCREAVYLLPQSGNTKAFLQTSGAIPASPQM